MNTAAGAETATLSDSPSRRGLARAVAAFVAPHPFWLAAAIVLPLLASALTIAGPVLIGRVTDAVIARDGDTALLLGVALIVVAVGQILLSAASEAALARFGEYVVRGVRDRIVDGLLRAPLRFIERHRAGEILQRSTAEIADLSSFVSGVLPALVSAVTTVVVAVVVLGGESLLLLLVAIVTFLPAATVLMWRFRRAAPAAFGAEAATQADVIDGFAEIVRVRTVLRHAGPAGRERFAAREAERNLAAIAATLRSVWVGLWAGGVTAVQGVSLGALLVAGSALVGAGTVSVGVVVTFVLASRMLFAALDELISLVADIEEAATGGAPARDLLVASGVGLPRRDSPVSHDRPAPAPGTLVAPGTLEVDGVCFAYGDGPPVLSGVDVVVADGERCCLVGRTGSGKSTLAKVIAGLYEPTAGSVRYAGQDLHALPAPERARRVAYVPQQVHLGTGTIRDELQVAAPGASDDSLLLAAHRLGLAGWLDRLPAGLDTRLHDTALSVGERQLVGIVRVALVDSPVLVLDEITSDLDPATACLVESALREVAAGRTLIVVAHRPETIAAAGRVIRLGSE